MKQKKVIQSGSVFLCTLWLLTFLSLPVRAASPYHSSAGSQQANAMGVNVYISTAVLQKQFQDAISQSLPAQFNQRLLQQTSQLPASSHALVTQLAGELVQPSATLTQLVPQQKGLAATINISLFPHDPHPMHFSMLVTFNKKDATTVQVGAQALPGQPAPPATGNLGTSKVPLSQLNSVNITPRCGVAAERFNGIPPSGAAPQSSPSQGKIPIFIEIPSAVISAGARSSNPGTMRIGPSLTVQNIQVTTQANGLMATTQIFLGPLQVAATRTLIQLSAANGKLIAKVTDTQLSVGLLSFPVQDFNQLIQQMVNLQLNAQVGNSLYVTRVAFGPTNKIPCAARGSLLLEGTTA